MFSPKPPINTVRWLPVVNTDSEVAPAFAVLEVVGVTSSGVVQIRKSTRDDNNQVLINGPSEIAVSGYGSASTDYPLVAYYSTADGTPVNAEHWGAKAGSWKIHKGYEGFLIIGGENGERVTVARDPRCPATGASSPYGYYLPPYVYNCCCPVAPAVWQADFSMTGLCANCPDTLLFSYVGNCTWTWVNTNYSACSTYPIGTICYIPSGCSFGSVGAPYPTLGVTWTGTAYANLSVAYLIIAGFGSSCMMTLGLNYAIYASTVNNSPYFCDYVCYAACGIFGAILNPACLGSNTIPLTVDCPASPFVDFGDCAPGSAIISPG